MSALFQEKNVTSVWIVEAGVVRLVPVQLAGSSGQDVLLASGVVAGQTVVTAGVNLLKPGQKVTLLAQTENEKAQLPTASAKSSAPASSANTASASVVTESTVKESPAQKTAGAHQ